MVWIHEKRQAQSRRSRHRGKGGNALKTKVVIIGGGFGGLNAAKSLAGADVEITLIDKTNHHLFQPLLYQVATAALSPGQIAVPIRTIFKRQKNVRVVLCEVDAICTEERKVVIRNKDAIEFDYLVIATGARHSYFEHKEWEKYAPGLKTINDALKMRERMLLSFERAEVTEELDKRNAYLTFVIVGGGPTGVEMAGAIAEIARKTMLEDFRKILPEKTRVLLVEGRERIIPTYSPHLSQKAHESLKRLGVEVWVNSEVTDITSDGVRIGDAWIHTPNVIWAAGNSASPLLKSVGVQLDKAGRVIVEPDLSIPGAPDIFVIGDAAHCLGEDGEPLPGLAPVAIQQGRYVAEIIRRVTGKEKRTPFHYKDRGTMATIGRAKAIASIGKTEFSGLIAWLLWSLVHIALLIGFRNKLLVMLEWAWAYTTYQKAARLITDRDNHSEP